MTVNDVYVVVTNRLLEPGGFQTGSFTQAQFLEYFAEVFVDFLERTGLSKIIVTQTVFAGTSVYTLIDQQLTQEYAFLDGRILQRTNTEQLNDGIPNWKLVNDTPTRWHQDSLPIKEIELVPNPIRTGVLYLGGGPPFFKTGDWFVGDGNLTTIGAQKPVTNTYALGDTIPLIPDSAVMYVGWGILRRIFSDDSELKDLARADYCRARWEEGLLVWKAAMLEEMLDDYENLAA